MPVARITRRDLSAYGGDPAGEARGARATCGPGIGAARANAGHTGRAATERTLLSAAACPAADEGPVMASQLLEAQWLFTACLGKLLIWINAQGWAVTLAEGYVGDSINKYGE